MTSRAAKIFSKPAADTPKPQAARTRIPDDGPAMTGNWSRLAYKGMEEKLASAQETLSILKESQLSGVLSGTIPVSVNEDQITDEIGTDRVTDAPEKDDEGGSFADLVANIKKRGLRTPIRIRPADPAWRPAPDNPFDTSGQAFFLQSGRRRLAACRELGIQPIAFLSFPEDQIAELDDLHERYFENVARRDLTTAEKLFSIGLISARMPDLKQAQIAEILHTSQPMVSRGAALYQNFEAVSKVINLASANLIQIDTALKQIKNGNDAAVQPNDTKEADNTPLPFSKKNFGEISARLGRNSKGEAVLTIKSAKLANIDLERILDILKNGAN